MIYIFINNTPKAAVLASILYHQANSKAVLCCVESIKEAHGLIEEKKPSYKDEIWFFGFPKDTYALSTIKKGGADTKLVPAEYSILSFWIKMFGDKSIPTSIHLLEKYFSKQLDGVDRTYFERFFLEEVYPLPISQTTLDVQRTLAFTNALIMLYLQNDANCFTRLWKSFIENQYSNKGISHDFLNTAFYKNAVIKNIAILQSQTDKAMNYRTLYCASPGMGELGIINMFFETKDIDCVVLYHFNGSKWVFIVAERDKQAHVNLSKYKTKDYCGHRQFEVSQTTAKLIVAAISRKD